MVNTFGATYDLDPQTALDGVTDGQFWMGDAGSNVTGFINEMRRPNPFNFRQKYVTSIVSADTAVLPEIFFDAGVLLLLAVTHTTEVTTPVGWSVVGTRSMTGYSTTVFKRLPEEGGSEVVEVSQAASGYLSAAVVVFEGATDAVVREDLSQTLTNSSSTISTAPRGSDCIVWIPVAAVSPSGSTALRPWVSNIPTVSWVGATAALQPKMGLFVDYHASAARSLANAVTSNPRMLLAVQLVGVDYSPTNPEDDISAIPGFGMHGAGSNARLVAYEGKPAIYFPEAVTSTSTATRIGPQALGGELNGFTPPSTGARQFGIAARVTYIGSRPSVAVQLGMPRTLISSGVDSAANIYGSATLTPGVPTVVKAVSSYNFSDLYRHGVALFRTSSSAGQVAAGDLIVVEDFTLYVNSNTLMDPFTGDSDGYAWEGTPGDSRSLGGYPIAGTRGTLPGTSEPRRVLQLSADISSTSNFSTSGATVAVAAFLPEVPASSGMAQSALISSSRGVTVWRQGEPGVFGFSDGATYGPLEGAKQRELKPYVILVSTGPAGTKVWLNGKTVKGTSGSYYSSSVLDIKLRGDVLRVLGWDYEMAPELMAEVGQSLLDEIVVDVASVSWSPPLHDGGSPVLGYLLRWDGVGFEPESAFVKGTSSDISVVGSGVVEVSAVNAHGVSLPVAVAL